MPHAKFTKLFDYQEGFGKPMTSYPKGYAGDISQSHYDKAAEVGAIEGENSTDVNPATADADALVSGFNREQLEKLAADTGVTDLTGNKAELAARIVASRG